MPTSYRSSNRKDQDKKTRSQSLSTNSTTTPATVEKLLSSKEQKIISVTENQTIEEAVGNLREHNIGALVVLSQEQGLCGIISERDVVRQLASDHADALKKKVSKVMTSDVKTCKPSDSLVSVLQVMTEGRFRHMPVLSEEKLLGMITIGDVISYRLKELEHESLQLKQLVVG